MSWGAVAGAAVGVVGSMMSSDAAGDASAAQSAASQQSNALQMYMYNNNVALQKPTIDAGNAARDRLQFLLGLSPTGTSGSRMINGIASNASRDDVRNALVGQYTTRQQVANGAPSAPSIYNADGSQKDPGQIHREQLDFNMARINDSRLNSNSYSAGEGGMWDGNGAGPGAQFYDQIDEAGLNSAIDAWYKQRDAEANALANDPLYGSLAQRFEFDKYTPDKFSYTGEDLYNDPSYLFRLQQGQKALDRQGAAAGRFLSGAQLQAASDYNQGAASQEFQNAYNRALGTFNTNENNRFNAFTTNEGNRFNAYQANFNNAVNPLLSLAGAATLGSQNLGAAGAATAAQMGNNLTAAANAQGAAGIASANQISSGINNAVNSYQSNNLLNSLLKPTTNVNNNPGGVSTVNTSNFWAPNFSGSMGD